MEGTHVQKVHVCGRRVCAEIAHMCKAHTRARNEPLVSISETHHWTVASVIVLLIKPNVPFPDITLQPRKGSSASMEKTQLL